MLKFVGEQIAFNEIVQKYQFYLLYPINCNVLVSRKVYPYFLN